MTNRIRYNRATSSYRWKQKYTLLNFNINTEAIRARINRTCMKLNKRESGKKTNLFKHVFRCALDIKAVLEIFFLDYNCLHLVLKFYKVALY